MIKIVDHNHHAYGYHNDKPSTDVVNFKPGDVVRVKPAYWKSSISGRWVVEKMLQKNWQCRRPTDYVGPSKHKFLRAKPHQIEKVPDTTQPTPSATKHLLNVNDEQFAEKFVAELATPKFDVINDIEKDIVVLRPGTVVLVSVKNPQDPDQFKGLFTVIEHGHTALTWIAVAPLFGGAAATVKTEYVTVIQPKDLTIAYLPQ